MSSIYLTKRAKFYLLSLMMFCIIFNQTYLRIIKDTVVITHVGANVIPFIKIFIVVPCIALFLSLYNRFTTFLSYKNIYLIFISIFMCILCIYIFILFPNAEKLQTSADTIDKLVSVYPSYLKFFIKTLANWTYTLFFALAEIWPDIMYSILFWTLLNHIHTIKDALYSYSLMSFLGNSAGILASSSLIYINSICNQAKMLKVSVLIISSFSIVSYLIVLVICAASKEVQFMYDKDVTTKQKSGLIKSIQYICNCRYLVLITICTCTFYCCINLSEFIFRIQLEKLHTLENTNIGKFLSICNFFNGVLCLILNLVANFLFKKFGIHQILLTIPIIISIFSVIFFVITCQSYKNVYLCCMPYSTLQLSVIAGAIQNIVAKSSKYSIWDVIKEILYIPLSTYEKTVGKASVEIISSKVGKAIAAAIPLILIFLNGKVAVQATYTFVIIIIIWHVGIKKLCQEYKGKINL